MSKHDGELISRSAILRKLRIKADGKSVIDGLFTAFAEEVCEKIIEPETAVDAVEVETLEAWLYEIAMNNTMNFLCDACEEIISRLDGLRVFAKERRANHVD